MVQFIDKSLQKNALQNIGAIDRGFRMVVGAGLIVSWMLMDFAAVSLWLAIMPLVGAIMCLSGIIGWCPVYALFNTKSCGVDSNNPCGTLPYQLSKLFHLSN
jgi:hypothetical protein